MATEIWVNIGSGNGLLPDGTIQAITWTNFDLSSVRITGVHLRAILREIPQPPVTKISLKITYLKFCSNLPGTNELRWVASLPVLFWPLHHRFVSRHSVLLCFTSLMASLIRYVGGLSKCFSQGLWLADLNADVIGQSMNRHVVA